MNTYVLIGYLDSVFNTTGTKANEHEDSYFRPTAAS